MTAAPTHFRIDETNGQIAYYYTLATAEQVRLGTATWVGLYGAAATVPALHRTDRIPGKQERRRRRGRHLQDRGPLDRGGLDRRPDHGQVHALTFNDQSVWTLTQHANVPVTQVAGTGLQFAIGTGAGYSELKLYGRDLTCSRTQVKIRTPVLQDVFGPCLRWELDADNYVEIIRWNTIAVVQVCVAGTLVQRASSAAVNPTNLSIRSRGGRIYFNYSTSGGQMASALYSCPAPFDLQYVFVKLIAGRTPAGGTAATLTLTDFSLTCHNVIFQAWARMTRPSSRSSRSAARPCRPSPAASSTAPSPPGQIRNRTRG